MRLPRAVVNLMEAFERLPGIGPKTAGRLTFYLLQCPKHEAAKLAEAAEGLKSGTVICSQCFNVAENDPCEICTDVHREQTKICVVEDALDVWAMEKMGKYNGVYHVLGGVINPLEHIGPEELRIRELIERVSKCPASWRVKVSEIILALNPTMEGEATCMYIAKQIKADNENIADKKQIKITRLARGLPTGGDLEYADETTLERAMEGRTNYK